MDKTHFRKKYKALRNELSQDSLAELSLKIANNALKLPIWGGLYYHVFLSIAEKKEVDTQFLLHILQGRDKSIVVSKANFETMGMDHYLLQEHTKLAVSSYGIPEPVEGLEVGAGQLDVVFIPLLAFDKKGHRIGYGKGFYDQFLSQCSPKAVFVGLSLFEAEETIPAAPHDIPLHYCVTPTHSYQF